MTNYQWTENTKPDRPGIWRFKGASNPYEVTEGNLSAWPIGSWCFLMDLPTIVDPPKYRDVRKGDEGKQIQVNRGAWQDWYFIGFSSSGRIAYEVLGCIGYAEPEHARILDDDQPKREPREFYINIGCCDFHFAYYDKETALDRNPSAELIHVREVIDESAS